MINFRHHAKGVLSGFLYVEANGDRGAGHVAAGSVDMTVRVRLVHGLGVEYSHHVVGHQKSV